MGGAAASQASVVVIMADDGEGSGTGGTNESGGSVTGLLFGTVVSAVSYTNPGLIVDLAGTASGQSFFRSVRVNSSITLDSSAATYNSGNNTWTWATGAIGPGTYTLAFFR